MQIACKAVAAMLHYFFLCVIAWMFFNGIYLYQKVQKATRPGSVVDLIYFCILGWGKSHQGGLMASCSLGRPGRYQ